jgi:hypothetical protein
MGRKLLRLKTLLNYFKPEWPGSFLRVPTPAPWILGKRGSDGGVRKGTYTGSLAFNPQPSLPARWLCCSLQKAAFRACHVPPRASGTDSLSADFLYSCLEKDSPPTLPSQAQVMLRGRLWAKSSQGTRQRPSSRGADGAWPGLWGGWGRSEPRGGPRDSAIRGTPSGPRPCGAGQSRAPGRTSVRLPRSLPRLPEEPLPQGQGVRLGAPIRGHGVQLSVPARARRPDSAARAWAPSSAPSARPRPRHGLGPARKRRASLWALVHWAEEAGRLPTGEVVPPGGLLPRLWSQDAPRASPVRPPAVSLPGKCSQVSCYHLSHIPKSALSSLNWHIGASGRTRHAGLLESGFWPGTPR